MEELFFQKKKALSKIWRRRSKHPRLPSSTKRHSKKIQSEACDGIIYRTEKLSIQKDYKTSDAQELLMKITQD